MTESSECAWRAFCHWLPHRTCSKCSCEVRVECGATTRKARRGEIAHPLWAATILRGGTKTDGSVHWDEWVYVSCNKDFLTTKVCRQCRDSRTLCNSDLEQATQDVTRRALRLDFRPRHLQRPTSNRRLKRWRLCSTRPENPETNQIFATGAIMTSLIELAELLVEHANTVPETARLLVTTPTGTVGVSDFSLQHHIPIIQCLDANDRPRGQ